MLAALSDRARRRPWAVLGCHLALLAALLAIGLGAPGELGIGSLRLEDPGETADLVVAARGDQPTSSRFFETSLDVIEAGISTDPAVESVRRGPQSGGSSVTYLAVEFEGDDSGEEQDAIERIRGEIDAGALRTFTGGDAAAYLEAREILADDLWRLELLALPLAAAALLLGLGAALGGAALISIATGLAGTLVAMRLAGAVADFSLLAIAPAAVVAFVLGIELPPRIAGLLGAPAPGFERASRGAALAASAAFAASLGLVATLLDEALSLAIGVGIAAVVTAAAALIATPAALALSAGRPGWGPGQRQPARDSRDGRLSRLRGRVDALPDRVRGSAPLAVALPLVVGALLVALVVPAFDGETRPFSSAQLSAGSEAKRAETLASEVLRREARKESGGEGKAGAEKSEPKGGGEGKASRGDSKPKGEEEGKAGGGRGDAARPQEAALAPKAGPRDSLYPELPLAGLISVALLALVLGGVTRSPRWAALAVRAVVPAAAICGLAVLVFQNGDGADLLGLREQAAIDTGALAAAVCALAAVGAARVAMALEEGSAPRGAPDPSPVRAMATATIVTGAAAGVLAGADLYPVREFGLLVAAGLVADLALACSLRPALGRWARR